MRSCVEDCSELKDGENADDYTGTETGEGDVDDKGGEIQTWGGDGSFEQFSVDGHAILLVWKWWMQDDFTSRKWCNMVELGDVKKRKKVKMKSKLKSDKGGEIQTWGEGSFEQFSVDGHAILLVWKWWMQDDFTSGKWGWHGWTWRCEETQKGKNVEQTKIWAYGEQLEVKSGLKCSIMMASWTCSLELNAVEL